MASSDAKVTSLELAMSVIAHEAVSCFCGKEQQSSVQPSRLTSCTGGIFWGKRGEKWPSSTDDQPLIPWLQVVCTEVDGLSGPLYNRKAVCFYVRQPFGGYEATSTFDGSDFVVREYALDDELVPLTRPAALRGHPYHHVTWKELRDFPSISKYCGLFDEAVYRALCEVKDFTFENHSGIKIGGWPTPVQRDQEYPGSHDLQIDMTENFMYGDSGIGYLSRDGERWYVTFDCC